VKDGAGLGTDDGVLDGKTLGATGAIVLVITDGNTLGADDGSVLSVSLGMIDSVNDGNALGTTDSDGM